jgi:hypothetical protein
MSIEHLETQFIKPKIYTLESKSGGVYLRYLSDLEVYEEELADLTMIVEMMMEKMKDRYCI